MMEIKTEPTEREIEDDLDSCDTVVIFNYNKDNTIIKQFIKDFDKNKDVNMEIVHIHHYLEEEKYLIGV